MQFCLSCFYFFNCLIRLHAFHDFCFFSDLSSFFELETFESAKLDVWTLGSLNVERLQLWQVERLKVCSCFSFFSCLICLHAFHYFICCFLNGLHYLNFKRLKVRGLMFERLAVFMLNVCNFDRLNVWTSDSLQFERLSLERLDIWLLNDWRCGGWRLNAWIFESLKFEWLKHRSSTLERLTDWRLNPWHFEHLKFQVLCVWALERLELRQFEVWTFECLNVWTFNVWSLNLCWLNL